MGTNVPEHFAMMKEKCEDKSDCVAHSCPGFWNANNVMCNPGDGPQIWISWTCLGGTKTHEIVDTEYPNCLPKGDRRRRHRRQRRQRKHKKH